MDINNLRLPEGLLSPEEQERFNTFQQKHIAYYAKYGEEMEWKHTAIEAGLLDVPELSLDDQQYLQAVSKVVDEIGESDIEGFEALKASKEKYELVCYFKRESQWLMDTITRKQMEISQRLLAGLQSRLAIAKAVAATKPDNQELANYIMELTELAEQFTTAMTVQELSVTAKEEQSDN